MKKTGKLGLMVGAATIALMSAAMAQSKPEDNSYSALQLPTPDKPLVFAQADTTNRVSGGGVSNADLAARVQALEDALASQSDRATADRTRLSTLEQNFNYASWTFDNGRPVLSTGDGRFTMGIRVRFQSDFASYMQDSTHAAGFAGPQDLSSGAVIRRAYFGVEGKVYNDFAYEIRLNAGGSDGGSFGASGVPNAGEGDPLLNKAVITYTGIANWHFSVGVLEPAFMMEGTTSSASLMFMERPDFENIAADSFGAGDSRRGIEVGWAKTDTLWAGDNITATATFSGGKTGSAQNHGTNNGATGDGDENTQILGRITDRLWSDGISNIQIGASYGATLYSGSNGNPDGGSQTLRFRDRPEIRVDGTRLIDTAAINAKTGNLWAFDAEGNWQNFYLGGEYSQFQADRQCTTVSTITFSSTFACGAAGAVALSTVADHPTFWGWAIEGSWILTGETKTYSPSAINNEVGGFNAPVPSRPFSLAGDSWGAWELVARYTDTNLNWRTTQVLSATSQPGILGGEEKIVSLGINWYMNRNVRLMIDDNIISVRKGTVAAPANQDLNVLGVRLQFAN